MDAKSRQRSPSTRVAEGARSSPWALERDRGASELVPALPSTQQPQTHGSHRWGGKAAGQLGLHNPAPLAAPVNPGKGSLRRGCTPSAPPYTPQPAPPLCSQQVPKAGRAGGSRGGRGVQRGAPGKKPGSQTAVPCLGKVRVTGTHALRPVSNAARLLSSERTV